MQERTCQLLEILCAALSPDADRGESLLPLSGAWLDDLLALDALDVEDAQTRQAAPADAGASAALRILGGGGE